MSFSRVDDPRPWRILLVAPLAISFILFAAPQFFFIKYSFHRNLGYGRIGEELTLENYITIFSDPFYLEALWRTVWLSGLTAVICLIVGFPVAYMFARIGARYKAVLGGLLVASLFITPVVKDLGLIILLSQNGVVNQAIQAAQLVSEPILWLNTGAGVVIGLVHYTLPLIVLLLATVIATVPRTLEDAAHAHGASRALVFYGVIIPIVKPGMIAAALMVFNLAMGAFTTPALLGGGRVLTFAILIQRSVILDVNFPFAASLSTVLLVSVFALNVLAAYLMVRQTRSRPALRPEPELQGGA